MKNSIKQYENFHGKEVDSFIEIDFNNPKQLVYLGKPISIVYESDKENGGGNGEIQHWEHPFHKDDILATDETGNQLYILGPKLKVNKNGIVN